MLPVLVCELEGLKTSDQMQKRVVDDCGMSSTKT